MKTAYLFGGLLLVLGWLALPVSADPHVIYGPCAHLPGTATDYQDCFGVTDDCNGGSFQLGIGHSFYGPNDGGGWCWVSVDMDRVAVCHDIDQQNGPTCIPDLADETDQLGLV